MIKKFDYVKIGAELKKFREKQWHDSTRCSR